MLWGLQTTCRTGTPPAWRTATFSTWTRGSQRRRALVTSRTAPGMARLEGASRWRHASQPKSGRSGTAPKGGEEHQVDGLGQFRQSLHALTSPPKGWLPEGDVRNLGRHGPQGQVRVLRNGFPAWVDWLEAAWGQCPSGSLPRTRGPGLWPVARRGHGGHDFLKSPQTSQIILDILSVVSRSTLFPFISLRRVSKPRFFPSNSAASLAVVCFRLALLDIQIDMYITIAFQNKLLNANEEFTLLDRRLYE